MIMKKFFKWLIISLLVIVGLYFIIALFAPSTYKVERSKTMSASPEIIYSQISHLKNWELWTEWARKDTTTVNTYEGNDGEVGSIMRWKSKNMGEGNVEITELVPNEKIAYKLTFIDWNSVSTGAFTIAPAGDSSKVSWSNEGEIAFMMRTMFLFMGGMDAMMGPDFEKGLANLDVLTSTMKPEPQEPVLPDYVISTITLPAAHYIGIRFDTLISAVDSTLFSTAYGELAVYAAENKIEMVGAPVCITYSWDQVNGRCEIVAAFPVPLTTKAPKGKIESIKTIPAEALWLDYYGEYMNIWMAHMAMDNYMKANSLKSKMSIEEYVTDPHTVPSYDSVLTKLYYVLEK